MYALKWKFFTSWCRARQQDPVNCPVGTVLEYLQARFSAGVSHSTVKVHVAALSAYHSPLDGNTVGKHPLVICFLRGALRMRPPVRSRVPTWVTPLRALTTAPRPVVLQAFHPPPFQDLDQAKLNCMCPVRALDTYVHRAALWRRSDQLLVCVGPPRRGLPATKHTISRWIVETITACYESSGLPSPLRVKAHSTASKTFSEGVPALDICNAAGWSTPSTFVRFYGLDIGTTPGSSVLSS